MTKEEIIEAIEAAKDMASHYLNSTKKRVFYSIRVKTKFGNYEKTGDSNDPNAFENFCTTLDTESTKPNVCVITIGFRDNHKELDANVPPIVLNESICANLDNLERKNNERQEQQGKNTSINSNILGILGLALGLPSNGLGELNDEFGTAGVLMGLQRQTMEREHAKQEQDRLMGEMKATISELKKQVASLEKENRELEQENEDLLDQMYDYNEIRKELKELKTNNGKIASVGAAMLSGVAANLLASSPLGSLMGFGQQPQQEEDEKEVIPLRKRQPQAEVEPEPTVEVEAETPTEEDETIQSNHIIRV